MMDLAEFTWGRYNGGATVPAGSYVELRTLGYVQSTSDQTLPQDGTFFRVGTAGNESASTLATTLNGRWERPIRAAACTAQPGRTTCNSPAPARTTPDR